jgi:hypothetical protein
MSTPDEVVGDELERAIPKVLLNQAEDLGAQREVLARLQTTHRELWSLEDAARSNRSGPGRIAEIKRGIDRANAERHRLIDELDKNIHTTPRATDIVRYSETVGELCDRLIILELKLSNATRLAIDEALPLDRRAICQEKCVRLAAWRDHLLKCLECQIDDIRAGRAALPPRSEFKMYNDPLLNPITRAESCP